MIKVASTENSGKNPTSRWDSSPSAKVKCGSFKLS